MKKNIMLGVNSRTNMCCKLSCLLSFDSLISSEIEANDFVHHPATDWGGRDEIERTLGFIKMKRTGKKIVLDKPIKFTGTDYDWGRDLNWEFEVDEIHELSV